MLCKEQKYEANKGELVFSSYHLAPKEFSIAYENLILVNKSLISMNFYISKMLESLFNMQYVNNNNI